MIGSSQETSVVHSTFSLERRYPAAVSRVFAAFANPETKRRWFVEGKGWEIHEHTADFRVGGREFSRFSFKRPANAPAGAPPDGMEIRNDTVYQDIVPDRRIVFAYTMTVGGHRMSASLGTVEISPDGDGTLLRYTEQGAFFENSDGAQMREGGWKALLDSLEKELRGAR